MQPTAAFPIRIIEREWVLEQEAMGSKVKFWFRDSKDNPEWLFKYPQANTGQHWAEKIAAEYAAELEIPHAKVELAEFDGVRGSATESFARDGRELYHGNQILAGQVLGYDQSKKFRQTSHTLANIFGAIERSFADAENVVAAKQRIAAYIVLDALIGNTDRHHENWGILVERVSGGRTAMIAPSFDHASSLGRELRDEGTGKCRSRILSENRVGQYSEGAPGAIYGTEQDRRGLSPLALARRAASEYRTLFGPLLKGLDKLKVERVHGIVQQIPAAWMSDTERQFAIELTCYNLHQLKSIAL